MRVYTLQGCPDDLWRRFRLLCLSQGKTISQMLFLLMEEAVRNQDEKKG